MKLKEYLDRLPCLEMDAALSIVPDVFAEKIFRRGPQTIQKWKKQGADGPLSTVDVLGNRYITAKCLLQKLKEDRTRVSVIKEKLLQRLSEWESLEGDGVDEVTVYYGEAMGWVDMDVQMPVDRKEFGYIACEVSRETWAENDPPFMLSALVTRTDTNMPGDGFYPLAEELRGRGLPARKHAKFVNKQIRKAWEFARGAVAQN